VRFLLKKQILAIFDSFEKKTGVFEKFRTFHLEKIKNEKIKKVCFCALVLKKTSEKMPYGYSRKRRAYPSRGRASKRARKSPNLDRQQGFSKSLIAKNRGKPFGFNTGQMLHIDRPVSNMRGAFPNRLYAKLRYVDQLTLNADNLTGLTGTEIPYRLNSLFDPYFLTGGHQPLGYDQLTPLYQRYKVYKVEVQVAVRGRASGSGLPFVAVNVRNGASTYTLGSLKRVGEIQEQPANTVLDGTILQSWSQTIWCHKVEGKTFAEYMAEDSYGALTSTNPSITPYIALVCGSIDEVTCGAYVTIGLVFHSFFYEPNPLAQS